MQQKQTLSSRKKAIKLTYSNWQPIRTFENSHMMHAQMYVYNITAYTLIQTASVLYFIEEIYIVVLTLGYAR